MLFAKHLQVFFFSFTAFGPWDDVVSLHLAVAILHVVAFCNAAWAFSSLFFIGCKFSWTRESFSKKGTSRKISLSRKGDTV